MASPLARIIARHSAVAETARVIIDPLALIIAAVVIVLPRYLGYKQALLDSQRGGGDELQQRRNAQQRPAQAQQHPQVGVPGTDDGPPLEPNINLDTAKGHPVDKSKNFARDLGNQGFNA